MSGGDDKKDDGVSEESETKLEVLMWGYFPGVMTSQRSPLNSPASVTLPETELAGDVCGGGCGFGMAVTASGKVVTWGSADDQGQSYLTSGRHGETPETHPLPTTDPIVKAAAGWAHCVTVTDEGEVYTWGWKECVPSGNVFRSLTSKKTCENEISPKQSSTISEQVGSPSLPNDKASGDENTKRRKLTTQQESETSIAADENLSMPPCLVNLKLGVKITSVAAGGRHTLALSDVGQVWGWGYGGEGQLGLGSRIKTVASPHLIPCIESLSNGSTKTDQESMGAGSEPRKSMGNCIKGIACGGRHSLVVTDTGVLLAFGWGLYGQCGQGNNDDLLRPTCVSSLLGTKVEAVAAGLWHTLCICANGCVHAFGGNQFGQLGLGTNSDQCEIVPKLLDAAVLESKKAKIASAGARHSAVLTESEKKRKTKGEKEKKNERMMVKSSAGDGTSMVSLVSEMQLTGIPHPKFLCTVTGPGMLPVVGGIRSHCVRQHRQSS